MGWQRLGRCWAALALLLVGVAVAARQDSFDGEYALARREAVLRLVEFAEWCGGKRLFAEREKAYASILALDPAQEAAHKGLKHTKGKDGSWTVPEKRTEPKNAGTESLPECATKRAEIAVAVRERGEALLQFYAGKVTPAQAALVLDDVVAIDAENLAAREARGEVKLEERWVLRETAAAKTRRAELKTLIQATAAAVPAPHPIEQDERERALGLTWKAALGIDAADGSPKVRVLGTCSPEEARKVAVQCHAAADVFRALTKAEKDLPPMFTVYLLASAAERDTFIDAWPTWKDEERRALRTWAGTGLPKEVHVARWDADEARRLDGAVRHVLGLMTLWNFGFDHGKAAWIWEGFGLYLTRELVGTRYTWYGSGPTQGDSDAKELLGRLMMSDVNWMNEAYQRAKRGKTPPLAKLFERKIDAMGVDDVLLSYAVSAYLVEGRAGELPDVFRRVGAAPTSAEAVRAALGTDLAIVDARLVRWLSERK